MEMNRNMKTQIIIKYISQINIDKKNTKGPMSKKKKKRNQEYVHK